MGVFVKITLNFVSKIFLSENSQPDWKVSGYFCNRSASESSSECDQSVSFLNLNFCASMNWKLFSYSLPSNMTCGAIMPNYWLSQTRPTTIGRLGGLEPKPFPQMYKGPSFFDNCEIVYCLCYQGGLLTIIKLRSNEIRKIPVKFLLYLNLKSTVPSYILFKDFPVPFLWIRPLPLKLPSCLPADLGCWHILPLTVFFTPFQIDLDQYV